MLNNLLCSITSFIFSLKNLKTLSLFFSIKRSYIALCQPVSQLSALSSQLSVVCHGRWWFWPWSWSWWSWWWSWWWASWCCRQPRWVAGAARGWCRSPRLWIPHKEPAGQPPSWAELHPLLWEGDEGVGVSRTWTEDVELCRVPCSELHASNGVLQVLYSSPCSQERQAS